MGRSYLASLVPHVAKWAQYFLEQSIAYSTYKSYASGHNQYVKFCNKHGIVPYPLQEHVLILYITSRVMKVLPKTAFKDLAAVRYFSLLSGFKVDYEKMLYLQQLKSGIKRVLGTNPPDKRLPCTYELLCDMRRLFNLENYDMLVMFTAFVCATCGLLRTGEFAAGCKDVRYKWTENDNALLQDASQRALWVSNLSAVSEKGTGKTIYYKLLLRATKTDIFRQTVSVVLGKGKGEICPVFLLDKMLAMRAKLAMRQRKFKLAYDRPLFLLENGTILSRFDVSKVLKLVAEKLGLDKKCFTGYSFRIGGATSYARRGYPEYIIKILGRWKSQAYRSYIKLNDKSLADLPSGMMNTQVVDPNRVFLYQDHMDS